jgi:hypothetical protein
MEATFPERCERKMCATCGALMPAPATKCTVCDTFQDWRRYLPFDATILALLTALVSVLATTVPVVVGWVSEGYSDMQVTYRDDVSGGIVVNAYNAGNIPGLINKISLYVPFKDATLPRGPFQGHTVYREQQTGRDQEDYFVLPKDRKVIDVTFDLKFNRPNLTKDDFLGDCIIHFEIVEFRSRGSQKTSFPNREPPDPHVPCNTLSVVGVAG